MNSNQIMIASNVLGDSKESKQLSQKKETIFKNSRLKPLSNSERQAKMESKNLAQNCQKWGLLVRKTNNRTH